MVVAFACFLVLPCPTFARRPSLLRLKKTLELKDKMLGMKDKAVKAIEALLQEVRGNYSHETESPNSRHGSRGECVLRPYGSPRNRGGVRARVES